MINNRPTCHCFNSSYGLWCLTPLSAIFQLYRGDRFIGGGQRFNSNVSIELTS